MKKYFAPSELIINDDGSIFHLHLKPEQLADKIILVGDPRRVNIISAHFSDIECEVQNREFHTVTGKFAEKRITVISTGIGCGNIDIVMNEIDALANIDFSTRTTKPNLRTLELVRIGTCGGLQENTPIGSFVCSVKSIGLDGLVNFYSGRDKVCDAELEKAFVSHMGWNGWTCISHPYVAIENAELVNRIAGNDMVKGITISSCGFFAPQGRELRVQPADARQNEKIESFEYQGMKIANYEMEGSALAGLAALLGHKAATVCMVIANRRLGEANAAYKNTIDNLISEVLERI